MPVFKLEAEIELKDGQYKAQLKEAGRATQETAKSIDASTVAIGNVIANLATKAGEFFVSAAKTGIQYNAQIEKYTTALTTSLGSEAEAYAAIEQIKQDAARTPYSVAGLVKANQYLISAGESAESARATILALTDAVSATGGGNSELERMALNLQQIRNLGKASSIDIKQFGAAGIPIYRILAEYTGKTEAQVKEMSVSYEDLSGALQMAASAGGEFYEANLRQSQTLIGQWSTLKDNVQAGMGEAFSGLADTLTSKVLPAVNSFVTSLDISAFKSDIGTAAASVAALVGPFVAVEGAAKAAAAATKLWQAALTNLPTVAVAAGLTVVVASTMSYINSIKQTVNEQRTYGESSHEVALRLLELREERQKLQDAADGGATEYSIYEQLNVLDQEIKASEERYNELAKAEEKAAREGVKTEEVFEDLTETTESNTTALAESIKSYDKLHEAVTKKVHSWFGLFDEVKLNVKTSVEDMMKNMQSQIDFNKGYATNLQYLADNGLSVLGSAFQNMGAEGAVYAETIVQAIEAAGGATSEGGQEIIANFQAMAEGISSSQEELAQSLTDITGTIADAFADAGATAEEAAAALDVSGAAGSAGAATVQAYIDAIAAGADGAAGAASQVAQAASAGFGRGGKGHPASGAGATPLAVGSDYIPYDEFPALLHKGEMVIPAKISEDLRDFVGAGGKTPEAPAFSGEGISEVVGLLHQLIAVVNRPIVLDSGQLVGGIGTQMDSQLGDIDGWGRRGLSLA